MILKKIKYYKKSIAFLVMMTLSIVACTDKFDELNTPKGTLTIEQVDVNMLGYALAEAQYRGTITMYQALHNLYAAAWAQYFTIIHPNFPSASFTDVGAWSEWIFTGFYTFTSYGAAATQLNFVEKTTKEKGMVVENAIAKVWRVQLYHRITDVWGPIIYSNFGNGKTSVDYDSQKDIYHNFFLTLDEAIAVLEKNPNARPFSTNDLVYDGDVKQYLKWINSLRLRLAMRIAYIEPALAKQEAEKAINSPHGVIVNNSDNANLKSTINSVNGLSSITYHTEMVMSATMQSILEGYEDPRASLFFQPCCGRLQTVKAGGFIGARNGLPVSKRGTNLDANYSFVGTKWLPIANGGTNEPDILMEAAEVYFLRAEGALRGWNMGGTAQQFYNDGIRASLKNRVNASDAVINAYIISTKTPSAPTKLGGGPDQFNSPPVSDIPVVYQALSSFETQLEQIITQKWLALFPNNDVEAWAERRRTGYPRGYAIIESTNPRVPATKLMRRLKFVPAEYSNNNAATLKAVTLLGGPDENDTRIWWDAKPLSLFPVPTDPK